MADLTSDIVRLNVTVFGNGNKDVSLVNRMKKVEDRIEQVDDEVSCLESSIATTVKTAINEAFSNRKRSGFRYFFDWITKLGPTIAAIAALITVLLKVK